MPTKDQVLAVLSRRSDADGTPDYALIADDLGIPAGRAFMIATGVPADGGDALAPEDLERPGLLPGSSQHLANPKAESPSHASTVRAWMKRRAAADGEMQRAAAGRDARPGEIVDPEETDVITALGRDHNQVNALLEQLSAIPGANKGGSAADRSRRRSIADMVTVAMSRHEAVEERKLWPKVRSVLPDGDALADEALAQEQHGKDVLAALGEVGPDEERFDELVEQLVESARLHVAFEDKVFLALRLAMPEGDRARLGKKVRRAERRAPTRPHPHAPSTPPAVSVAGAAAAVMDSVRDHAGERPAEREGRAGDDPWQAGRH